MNKLLTKIAVSLIGVTLAIGVGVAAGRSGSDKAEPVQAATSTLSFTNIGSGLNTTSNEDVATIKLYPTESPSTGYDFYYLQCKKQGSAALLAKGTGAYFANKDQMPGIITKVTVTTSSGAANGTTYWVTYPSSACSTTPYTVDYDSAFQIGTNASHDYEAFVQSRFFCISLGNANNGQVLNITVTYKASDDGKYFGALRPGDGNSGTWTNSKKTSSATVDSITFTALGSGANDGKYYSSDNTWRFYASAGLRIEVPSNYRITRARLMWTTGQPVTPSGMSKDSNSSPTDYTLTSSSTNQNSFDFMRDTSNFFLKFATVFYEKVSSSSISLSTSSMNIYSNDSTAKTITVSLTPSNTFDQKVNIAKYSGDTLVTISASQITLSSGSGSFTVTGKGETSGEEIIKVSANDNSSVYATLTITALDSSVTTWTISLTNTSENLYLDGDTIIPDESDVGISGDYELFLKADQYYKIPSEITVTGAGDKNDGWTYDSSTGEICILEVTQNITISGTAVDADVSLKASNYKDEFLEGESFDVGELEVYVVWDDDPDDPSTLQVDIDDCIVDSDDFNSSKPGSYLISVTYEYNEEELYDIYEVTVLSHVTYSYLTEDELTQATFGVGKSYTEWSGKSKANSSSGIDSGAVYAGKTATPESEEKGAGSIQMNSTNPNAIITTTSGGLAKKITVVWHADTDTDRTLDIYGKNTAYSASSDLWDNTKKGTLIGSIVKGTSTELDINSDYAFIGIRSRSNALYLNSITIKWDEKVAPSSDVSAVNTFITNNMHPSISSSTSGTGLCKSSGWYTAAKTAFASLSDRQKAIILTSSSFALTSSDNDWYYNQIKDRLSAWAKANGETFNTSTGAFSSNTNVQLLKVTFDTTGSVTLIILSILVLTTVGGYFYMRKRKEVDIND